MSAVMDESPFAAGAALPPLDTGLVCLVLLARFHQAAAEAAQLAHEFGQAGSAFATREILLAARKLKLKARAAQTSPERLARTPLPAIAAGLRIYVFSLASSRISRLPVRVESIAIDAHCGVEGHGALQS